MSVRIALGERTRALREQSGLTQQELAEAIGVESPSYISKIERGMTSPSYELLVRIARVLKVEIKDLFDADFKREGKPMEALDKWLLKFRSLLKGRKTKEIKIAYDIIRKILCAKND
ncbi:MAG: helix-turn-helix transcriptional regulator [Deltaproteobacteria bacterium]|nr:helix-turn-helix transcriptional regulator [Deltaproteobacteria bacterium]